MSSPAAPSVRHYQFVTPITGAAHEAYVLVGAEDTDFSLKFDTDYAIIVKVGNTGEMSASGDYQLQVQIDGGGFNDVNASSSNFRSAASGDTEDATSTTERLSTSAETFQTSVLDEVEGLIGTNITGGNEHEFYFCFNVRSAELSLTGHIIEFRLTTATATFPHDLQLFAHIDQPVTAYTPTLEANRSEFKRRLITPPHPAEYPQAAAPTTARVTHLTAAVLFDQAPPTTRVTHLTVSVLYGTPTAAGVPQTNAKAMEAFKWSFERRLQLLPHPDDTPATPEPPEPFTAYTPVLKANRTAFKRELQPVIMPEPPKPTTARVTHLTAAVLFDQAPPTTRVTHLNVAILYGTPTDAGVPQTNTKAMQAFTWSFERRLQILPHPEDTPATPIPPEPFTAYTPVLKAFVAAFERELRHLPELDEYPQTPAGFFDGFWPASLTLRPFEIEYDRQRLDLPEHDVFPPTPLGFFDGFWPGSKRVDAFNWSFKRALQRLPQHDRFPPPPVSAVDYPGLTAVLKSNTISFDRHIQAVLIPPEYPPTPPNAGIAGETRIDPFTWSFDRALLQPLELNQRPPTPAGFFDGFYPGSAAVKSFRVQFDIQIQAVLELDEHPATPAPIISVVAQTPALKANRVDFKRTLQILPHPEDTPAAPVSTAAVTAFTPALKANVSDFRRDIQSLPPHPEDFPATPTSVSVVAQTPALKANRVEFKRTLQILPHPEDAAVTPFVAWTPAEKALRSEFTRTLITPLELNERPPTPFGFQWGFYPGSARVEANSIEFKRTRRDLPLLSEHRRTPIDFRTGQWPAHLQLKPFRVEFTRSVQAVIHNAEHPQTPPIFVNYPSQFAVPTIRRRETRRKHQAAINAHVYTPTSPLFYAGEYPASRAVKLVKESEFNRTHRRTPIQPQFPPAVPGFRQGFWPASAGVTTFTHSFERQLVELPQLDEHPATPPGFFTGFWTGFLQLKPFKIAFTRTLQKIPLLPAAPPTPPVFIEMPSPWAAQSIRRRETRRTLQMLPQPPRAQGFRTDEDIECKWWADCQPIKWEADAAPTVWTADWTDTWEADCD